MFVSNVCVGVSTGYFVNPDENLGDPRVVVH